MISIFRSNRRPSKLERVLWFGVGLIALLPLLAVITENPGDILTDFRMAYSALFVGIAVIGLLLNWGPAIPCSILGIAISTVFTKTITSSHEEALFNDLGIPLIGATLGAIVGIMIDSNLTHPDLVETAMDGLVDANSDQRAT